MGNACSCVRRPKSSNRRSAEINNTNGAVAQSASDTATSGPELPPPPRQIVVINRIGGHNDADRQHVTPTIVVQRRPNIKTLILEMLNLIRSLTARWIVIVDRREKLYFVFVRFCHFRVPVFHSSEIVVGATENVLICWDTVILLYGLFKISTCVGTFESSNEAEIGDNMQTIPLLKSTD